MPTTLILRRALLFSADGRGGNYARLNFTFLNEEDIRVGVERFSREATALLN